MQIKVMEIFTTEIGAFGKCDMAKHK